MKRQPWCDAPTRARQTFRICYLPHASAGTRPRMRTSWIQLRSRPSHHLATGEEMKSWWHAQRSRIRVTGRRRLVQPRAACALGKPNGSAAVDATLSRSSGVRRRQPLLTPAPMSNASEHAPAGAKTQLAIARKNYSATSELVLKRRPERGSWREQAPVRCDALDVWWAQPRARHDMSTIL